MVNKKIGRSKVQEKLIAAQGMGKEPEVGSDLRDEKKYSEALNWYNYFMTTEDCKDEFLKSQPPEISEKVSQLKPYEFISVGKISKLLNRKMILSEKSLKIFEERKNELFEKLRLFNIEKTKEKTEEKKYYCISTYKNGKPMYQHYTEEEFVKLHKRSAILSAMIADIDEVIDDYYDRESYQYNLKTYFGRMNPSQSVLDGIKNHYTPQLEELNEYFEKKTPDLIEAYSYYEKSHLNKIREFFKDLISLCEFEKKHKKAQRQPRKKKPVSIEKLLSKFEYMKVLQELNLVSFDPVDIIKSEIVWVYNHKDRKLNYIKAKSGEKLTVRGKFLDNAEKAECKRLRKPKEFLEEFSKGTSAKKMKMFNELTTQSYPFNKKITKECVLLYKF